MSARCFGGILARVPHEGPLPKAPMLLSLPTYRSFTFLLIVHFLFETGTSSVQGCVHPYAPHMERWPNPRHPKRGTHSQPPFPKIERIGIFSDGDSSKEAQADLVQKTRFRLVSEAVDGAEPVYEPCVVLTKRGEASWIECFKMEVAGDIIRGRRPHEARLKAQSAKRKAAKAFKEQKRDSVKAESIAAVVRRVKAKSSAVAPAAAP